MKGFGNSKKYKVVTAVLAGLFLLTGCSFEGFSGDTGKTGNDGTQAISSEINTSGLDADISRDTATDSALENTENAGNTDTGTENAENSENADAGTASGENADGISEGAVDNAVDAGKNAGDNTDTADNAEENAAPEEYFVNVGNEETGEFISVGSNQYVADISGITITDIDAFKAQIEQLPNLLYIDMCDCGLTNDQMEDLMNTFPSVRFVWMIHMTSTNAKRTLYWDVRTDALAFSTLHAWASDPRLDNDDAQQLKYCTDLVALDFGHNAIYDTSFMENMNMHILITVDSYNRVEQHKFNDISVISNFPNLMYLEIFVGAVTDTSAIAGCKEMVDLNISYNPISTIEDITDLPHLERLTIESTNISYADYQKLCEIYPNAKICYYGSGSVDNGWRGHKRYFAMIDMFRNNYWNDLFRTEAELEDVASYDMVVLDGERYYGTPYISDYDPRLGFDGALFTSVGENNIPTEDKECNFDGIGSAYKIIKEGEVIVVYEKDGKLHYFYRNEVLARLLCEKLDENGVIRSECTATGLAAKIAYEAYEAEEAEYNEAIWEAQQAANALNATDSADASGNTQDASAIQDASDNQDAENLPNAEDEDKAGVAEDNSATETVEK